MLAKREREREKTGDLRPCHHIHSNLDGEKSRSHPYTEYSDSSIC